MEEKVRYPGGRQTGWGKRKHGLESVDLEPIWLQGSLARKSISIGGIATFVRYVTQLCQIPGNGPDVPRSKVAPRLASRVPRNGIDAPRKDPTVSQER